MKTNLKAYSFKDLSCEELDSYGNQEYYMQNDVDDEINRLEDEVEELEEKVTDLENAESDRQDEEVEYDIIILEFAKWCNKNRVNANKIPHTELEFNYEKFQDENPKLFS